MTEIIIDGVNVAGCCKCYNVEQKILCGVSGICANNPNCYYKQLQTLARKYDTLTNKFFNSETDKTRLEQENKELKEENERLKKDFSSYEDDIEDWVSDNSILYQYDDRTPDTLEELQACMESTHEQWQKYKAQQR